MTVGSGFYSLTGNLLDHCLHQVVEELFSSVAAVVHFLLSFDDNIPKGIMVLITTN